MTSAAVGLRRRNRATLDRQGLLERRSGTPAAAIAHLAGLQAQHANQPYIALWSRLDGLTIGDLTEALEDRSVVKATVMRATLHLVAAADLAVFDATITPARRAIWSPYAAKAGVDLGELHAMLIDFCSEPRTVAEMELHLDGLVSDEVLARHVPSGVRHMAFRMASTGGGLVHVPPSGVWGQHGKPRYIAATTWLGDVGRPVDLDEALRIAAERYLTAYGPATLADLRKWLGQSRIGPVRAAIEALGDRLRRIDGEDGTELLDVADGSIPQEDRVAPPRFLSRWDSVLISYDDRDRILPPAYRDAVIKKNGDFLPTFLIDGVVAGLWSMASKKGLATLRLEPFAKVSAADRRALETEGQALLAFADPEARDREVTWA